ncbi:RDD family protein [Schlesneria paludicola]|uniref:RDD family protein n=1 Tax=Schlesneria paludicola TaxID=360056 RepID=UPI00029B1B17|nr:RDD family protein [Schlesneria paludicola]
MSSSTNQTRPWSARKIAFAAIAGLSLYLPSLVASWSFTNAFAGLRAEARLTERKIFGMNCIKEGQAWFISSQRKEHASSFEYSIKRIDLKTGVIHETGFPKSDQSRGVLVIGNELYIINSRDIFKVVDDQLTLIPIGSFPPPSTKSCSNLFRFDDKLTLISRQDQARFRLIHLVDGDWIEGPEILMPTESQIWSDEPEFVQSVQDADPKVENDQSLFLNVVQDKQGVILFLTSNWRAHPTFGAFKTRHLVRRGFPLVENQDNAPPARHSDQPTPDATDWELTTTMMPNGKSARLNVSIQSIESDANGPLLSFSGLNSQRMFATTRICRRGADGQLRDLDGLNPDTNCLTVVDPSDGTAYLIEELADHWNSVAFRRIVGDTIQPAFLSFGGGAGAYIVRWQYLLAGLLVAWMLHYLIMLVASACLAIDVPRSRYECDMHTATIAPIWRRVGGATIDLLVFVVTLIAVWYGLTAVSGVPWTDADDVRTADQLNEIHYFTEACLGMVNRMELVSDRYLEQMLTTMTRSLSDGAGFYARWIGLALVVCGFKWIVEAYRGITLGKWLFGTRTASSTLTHPGLLGVSLRTALCPFDFFFLLTPIPAIAFMWLSSQHRRLGDHCADTIVIRAGSIRTADWYRESLETQ